MTIATESSRPRRWFQFGLRTMFVVVTVVAVPAAWASYNLNWIRQRHAAEAAPGLPRFVSYAARETLHRRSTETLSWGLRLFGEQAVPLVNCGPASKMKVDDLKTLFPEAEIIEVWYPSNPPTRIR